MKVLVSQPLKGTMLYLSFLSNACGKVNPKRRILGSRFPYVSRGQLPSIRVKGLPWQKLKSTLEVRNLQQDYHLLRCQEYGRSMTFILNSLLSKDYNGFRAAVDCKKERTKKSAFFL